MKKNFKYVMMAVSALVLSASMTACDDDDNKNNEDSLDTNQIAILENYVDGVVIPTYASLATATEELADLCEALAENPTADAVKAAGDKWIASRKYWELSEAFLFGAAADYNIDPHIDSWPLNLSELNEVLKAGNIESRLDAGTAGYGLLGFHAVEYVLFREGKYRPVAEISEAELAFAVAVSADMRDQCIRLKGAWAGETALTEAEAKALEEAELDLTNDYGAQLKASGMAGNVRYKTLAKAFEEILTGASDITNEVGNTKISDPINSQSVDDVESPHSWNSVVDFADNIRSVRNAYLGTLDGKRSEKSVSVHIASLDKALDEKIQSAIADAIAKIEQMKKPFRNNLTFDANNQAAVDACVALRDLLDEAIEVVNK